MARRPHAGQGLTSLSDESYMLNGHRIGLRRENLPFGLSGPGFFVAWRVAERKLTENEVLPQHRRAGDFAHGRRHIR